MFLVCPKTKDHHFDTIWDYLGHMKKCKMINESTDRLFMFCPGCLQSFHLHDPNKDIHIQGCRKKSQLILEKWVFKCGKDGIVDEVIQHYRQAFDQQQDQDEQLVLFNEIKYFKQQVGSVQKLEQQIVELPNLRESKYSPNVTNKENKKMEFIEIKWFQEIKLVDRYDEQIQFENIKKVVQDCGIAFDENYIKSAKVCELAERTMYRTDKIFFYISHPENKFTRYWILVEESNKDFAQYIERLPWAIFLFELCDEKDLIANLKEKRMARVPKNPQLIELDKKVQDTQREIDSLQQRVDDQRREINIFRKKNNDAQHELQIINLRIERQEQTENSIETQLEEVYKRKVKEGRAQLIKFYSEQKKDVDLNSEAKKLSIQIEQYTTLLDDQKKEIEQLKKEKQKQVQEIEIFINKTKQCEEQLKALAKVQNDFVDNKKINLQLCIKCKLRNRTVIQMPCQHLLFCETCFVEYSSEKNPCPLKAIGQCNNNEVEKKFKKVNIKY